MTFLRRLHIELSRAWCAAFHDTYDLRFLVHRNVGLVAICSKCRTAHCPWERA